MIFGPNHYVPILKVKQGEKAALRAIAATTRAMVTPLLEIVERKPEDHPTTAAHLENAFKGLAEAVRPYSRSFLDVHEMENDGPSAAADAFAKAYAEGMVFTPVTGITRTVDVVAALSHAHDGIAIRLIRAEFEAGGIGDLLTSFLSKRGLALPQVDLIVDLGAVDDLVLDGMLRLATLFLADVPSHALWRTLTVTASAFPMSMGVVAMSSHAFIERTEWKAWRDGLYANRRQLVRLPTFGDCAIQHPAGVEGFDPRIMPVSASVRYALPEEWLIIKGQSTRAVPAREQFPELADQLVNGTLKRYFAGSAHCMGCSAMAHAADGVPGFGSPAVWRRLGTAHHITQSAEALAALTWP